MCFDSDTRPQLMAALSGLVRPLAHSRKITYPPSPSPISSSPHKQTQKTTQHFKSNFDLRARHVRMVRGSMTTKSVYVSGDRIRRGSWVPLASSLREVRGNDQLYIYVHTQRSATRNTCSRCNVTLQVKKLGSAIRCSFVAGTAISELPDRSTSLVAAHVWKKRAVISI